MRLRMLKTAAGPDGVLSLGGIYDVPKAQGRPMVEAGAAEWLDRPKGQVERAVQTPAENAAGRANGAAE